MKRVVQPLHQQLQALSCVCAAALALSAADVHARTLAEVKALGAISLCANPDALPYSSKAADTPGFQVELAREIAKGLGLSLNVEWILPRRRARVVNCDMLIDSVNDPEGTRGACCCPSPIRSLA